VARLAPSEGECHPCPIGECATCSQGVANLSQGWRLNGATDAMVHMQLAARTGNTPLLVFLCPQGGRKVKSCPALPVGLLRVARNASDVVTCRGNHTGTLCAVCLPGFNRKGSSDSRCVPCDATTQLGISPQAFSALVASLCLCGFGVLYPRCLITVCSHMTAMRMSDRTQLSNIDAANTVRQVG
jgi:hypothetical protein